MGARPFTPRSSPAGTTLEPPRDSRPPVSFRRGREASALLLFAIGTFLCLALLSFRVDPNDSTLSGPDWVGPVGALLAGVLVRSFGLVAWLVPLELALVGVPLLRGRGIGSVGFRVAGDLVVFIVLSSLVHVAAPQLLSFGQMPAGGNVGFVFGELMRSLFSEVGSFLVGFTAVGLILISRYSFSFISFLQKTGAISTKLGLGLGVAGKRVGSAWSEARRIRVEEKASKAEAAQPQITHHKSDEAIIAELADDSEFVAPDTTGTPPLCVSTALKAASVPPSAELLDAVVQSSLLSPRPPAEAPPVNVVAEAPVEPKKARTKRAAEPRIVDTKPEEQIKRGAGPKPKRTLGYEFPSPALLAPSAPAVTEVDRSRFLENASLLVKTLADYGVTARVEEIHPGPTVTMYEVAPEAGTKVSKVAGLADDLALGLSRTVRIIAPIPGKSRIGFEIPNDERVPVNLRELIEDKRFASLAERAPLPVVLGRDIVGVPFYADLASMPHVIVAGATGAGKSVGLNVMLSSLLFCRGPDELRFLMIDPKVVELAPYDRIPHLLLPVVTDMKRAATALRWAVDEMERRYQLFANAGTKNIGTYNAWVKRVVDGEAPAPTPDVVQALAPDGSLVSVPAAKEGGDGKSLPHKLPYIVIVVDEFADLMMQQGKDVEACVARLAQKARAAGMHVVLATQRPSVDVITGMIKANFPSRIGFRVAQKVDSRTILDEQGAELLLGRGDMLVKVNGSTETRRVQCPFVSEEEVAALTDFLRKQGAPEYREEILAHVDDDESGGTEEDEPMDPRFDEAVRIVAETQRCSTSWLQRKMTIGYNRAAKMVEQMEKQGMVGPPNGARDREVLIPPPS
jgi:S-DNA-T family DNA segregation ATPase FtsK/SpoIIIE